jgi:uncharacterized protein
MLTDNQKAIIVDSLQPFNPVEVGIFGSFARGEEGPESDIDILIDFGATRLTLFDLVQLGDELEEKLGRKVDLVTRRALHPFLKPIVEQELVIIMDAA